MKYKRYHFFWNRWCSQGCVVTIDAMGCQKDIAKAIIDRGADYLLAVKDNQPTLHREIKEYFDAVRTGIFADASMRFHEVSDKGHGRVETRRCWSTSNIEWFEDRAQWKGLRSFGSGGIGAYGRGEDLSRSALLHQLTGRR